MANPPQREPMTWATLDKDYTFLKNLANQNSTKFYEWQKRMEDQLELWTQLLNDHRNETMVLLPDSLEIVVNEWSRSRINLDFMKALDPSNQSPEIKHGPMEDENLMFQIDDLFI